MGRKKRGPDAPGLAVWQPKGFNPLAHLPQDLHCYADYARFYVGLIVHLTSQRKEEDLDFEVQLSFDFAQRFFPGPRVYKRIKDALVESGAVECDRRYIVGEKSMAYCLGESYQAGGLEKVGIQGKAYRILVKRLRAWQEGPRSGLNEVHRHLLKWVRSVRIGRYARTALDETLDSYQSDRVQLDNIAALSQSAPSLVVPLKKCNYGRVHTPVAYGWSGFRYHLTINKARLVGIDMRNSQPLLFGLVLRALCHNGGRMPAWLAPATEKRDVGYLDISHVVNTRRADEERKDEETSTMHNDRAKPPTKTEPDQGGGQNLSIMTELSGLNPGLDLTEVPVSQAICAFTSNNVYLTGGSAGETFCVSPEEIQRYVELCEAGEFYDQLLKRLDVPGVNRSEFKVRMFRNVFFGEDRKTRHTPEWEHFAAEFPTIAGVIRGLKQRYGHGVVAWLLTRVESSLIIDRICRRLMEEAPDVPVVTIHDMILTTSKHRRQVEQVLCEEYERVGLHPTLNIEDYGRQPPPKRTPKPRRRRRRRDDPDQAA